MPFNDWFREVEKSNTVGFLAVTPEIAAGAATLPEHHKDPQDRIIIATALAHRASLMSFDEHFPAYRELDGLLIQRSSRHRADTPKMQRNQK
jgi:PIN domain nuclease of toxin-antitoxin system